MSIECWLPFLRFDPFRKDISGLFRRVDLQQLTLWLLNLVFYRREIYTMGEGDVAQFCREAFFGDADSCLVIFEDLQLDGPPGGWLD